jgi:hypothetical protein
MNKLALAFFSAAPAYGLVGMAWGMQMGASGDHSMMPAHAHLNLLGLVLNGVFGAFYAFAGDRAGGKLGWANFWLSNVGVLFMIPTLVTILAAGGAPAPAQIAAMTVGEVATVLGLLLFGVSVWKLWRKA